MQIMQLNYIKVCYETQNHRIKWLKDPLKHHMNPGHHEPVEENEVNLAELKPCPPYVRKLLRPSNGNNPPETARNNKFVTKTYTFDVTKCDEIFDLLVADGQIIVPMGLKVPPLDKRKKKGFCKY